MDIIGSELKLHMPFSMTIAGPSGCGKTKFVLDFVKNIKELVIGNVSKIYYCYGIYQNQIEDFSKLGVECVPGLPEIDSSNGEPILCIFDDLMLGNTKKIANFFTHMRHVNLGSIFLCQGFYFDDKYLRLITRNSNIIILFKCPRDASIAYTLGKQMYPGNSQLLVSAFQQCTANPFGRLLIDCRANTPEHLRLRQGILPQEDKYVYISEKFNG